MELTQNHTRQLNQARPRLFLLRWDTDLYHITASGTPDTLCLRDPNTTDPDFRYFIDARYAVGCTICPKCWKAFAPTQSPTLAKK